MISATKIESNSAPTASGVGSCSDKINLQLYKFIVDLRDRPHLSKRVTVKFTNIDISCQLYRLICIKKLLKLK